MGTEMLAIRDLIASCPNVYTLPGTWTKCNAIIPHYNANPNITFWIFNSSYYCVVSIVWYIQRVF